ncbi:MAG: fumarylacetoacetate hydrolase family protein [Burkholderiales bacterium]|nr:fumarylacetoacetate hydrolase family protein [Burkholderiales bacterium]
MAEDIADALVRARREQSTLDAEQYAPQLQTAADAYAVQRRVAQALGYGGDSRFWKSGGPSREVPLTHAALPPAGVRTSPADVRDLHFNLRLIEAEVAFRLGADLQPEAMCVSIEVVDSRWQQGPQGAPALHKLADLQSHGALALGQWVPYAPRDWSRQKCQVFIGDAAPREFTGTHLLGEPEWLLPAFKRHANPQPGTIVTTGTWCGVLPAQAGDRVRVVFEGIGESVVQL